jgi:hypothetical protein
VHLLYNGSPALRLSRLVDLACHQAVAYWKKRNLSPNWPTHGPRSWKPEYIPQSRSTSQVRVLYGSYRVTSLILEQIDSMGTNLRRDILGKLPIAIMTLKPSSLPAQDGTWDCDCSHRYDYRQRLDG